MDLSNLPLFYVLTSGLWVVLNTALLAGSWLIRRSGSTWPGLLMLQGAAAMVLLSLPNFGWNLIRWVGGPDDWIQWEFAGVSLFQVLSLLRLAAYTIFTAGFLMLARALLATRPGGRVHQA